MGATGSLTRVLWLLRARTTAASTGRPSSCTPMSSAARPKSPWRSTRYGWSPSELRSDLHLGGAWRNYHALWPISLPLRCRVPRTSRLAAQQKTLDKKIVTQIVGPPAPTYYLAEEYHQDYFRKNGGGACHF